ncbi:hypothetical protein ACIA6C_27990 [Streptomyces sp. NPDC051578]|uniref:hypothetical protein n=1 Tax=Streptomyces sp. NPDC051578 TaxID=3365662 RepID=UPI00379D70FF
MGETPWTIERICDALGHPALSQRCLSEINRAPAHELLTVFAKWERIAKNGLIAVERARALAGHDERGEQLPGNWADATHRILGEPGPARGAA